MSDEILDVVSEYQRLEKSTGEPKLRWLEAKAETRFELQDRGFSKEQAANLVKCLPATLAAREFLGGLSARLSVIEAVNDLLDSPAGKQALGLHAYEEEVKFFKGLEKLSPASRITAARERGIRL